MSERKDKRIAEPLFEIREYEAELFAPMERKVEAKVEETREAELFPDMSSMIEGVMQPMVMMLTLGMAMPVMQQAMVGVLQSTEVTVVVKPGSIVAVDVQNSILAVEVKGGTMNVTVEGGTINVKTEPGTKLAVDIAAQSVGDISIKIADVESGVVLNVKAEQVGTWTVQAEQVGTWEVNANITNASLNVKVESGQIAVTFQESQYPDNLLSNPGFEEGSEGWALGSGWSIDNAEFYAGAASAKGVQGASESFIYSSDVIKVTPGQLFTVIAVFRGSGLTGNGLRLALRCLDPVNQQFLRYIYGEPHTDDVEGEWKTVRHVFTIPDDTGYVQVAVSLDAGSGVGWVDNVYAAKGQIHQIGQTIIGQMGTINVAIVQSDVTINISVVNATIAMPIDIQGSTIALAIDIQATTIALPVDIQAQTINLKIDIAAQSIDLIKIDIANASIGRLDINISDITTEKNLNINIKGPLTATGKVDISIGEINTTDQLKIDIANVSHGAIEVKQSGTWTVNIQNTAETAIYIQTAPGSKLDINITHSDVDLTIVNPSGIPIYSGRSIISTVTAPGGVGYGIYPGDEITLLAASGRGVLRHIAIWMDCDAAADGSEYYIRIYVDGASTPNIEMSFRDMDLMNGCNVMYYSPPGVDELRQAPVLSKAGGLVTVYRDPDGDSHFGVVFQEEVEFTTSIKVTVYAESFATHAVVYPVISYGRYP